MYTKESTKKLSVEIAARDAVDKNANIILTMGLYNDRSFILYSSS
jgi:hypothetical protein